MRSLFKFIRCIGVSTFIGIILLIQCLFMEHVLENKVIRTHSKHVVHLSIDDAECIFDLIVNENKYSSIFDQPFLNYLKTLHEEYDIKVTLYTFSDLFISSKSYSVSELSQRFLSELSKNSTWLKIGYHWEGFDFNPKIIKKKFKNSFQKTYDTFHANNDSSIWSKTLRLHYFYSPDSLLECLENVRTLLCADTKGRQSYDLTINESKAVEAHRPLTKNGIVYIPTDIRIENYFDIKKELYARSNYDTLVVFTHEWALTPQSINQIIRNLIWKRELRINALNRHNLLTTLKWLHGNSYQYTFLE